MASFEAALTHFTDHPSAIVGLSNILLDIYTEQLLPPPSIPPLVLPGHITTPSASTVNASTTSNISGPQTRPTSNISAGPLGPLGLPVAKSHAAKSRSQESITSETSSPSSSHSSSAALLDRLAARDRAYGLLSGLTKLGTGWNYSEAWYALARAYEEGDQPDKARQVLWWCVELEDAKAVRDWSVVGVCGYVL